MKRLEVNPSNEHYYTKDFISGFRCGTKRQLESDLTVIDKIRAEIDKPVIRDEYSQRQNDYCDGYEFVCNRIKEIIGDIESEDKE